MSRSHPHRDYSSSSHVQSFVPPDLTGRITQSDNQYCAAGSFGDVYRCQYHSECEVKEVAVKSFRFEFTLEEEDKNGRSNRMIRRELGIWKRLSHPNIVPFLGTVSGFGRLGNTSLVSSWMLNGTLQDFLLKHDDGLTVAHRLQFLLGIANGLRYLHSLSIVHGDLTCNNVLLDERYSTRLTDFGYASLVGETPEALAYLQASTLRPGTVRWAAPEHFSSNPEELSSNTTKSDIYSFGNVALQVLSGKLPWSEFQRDAVVVLHLASGHKPRRPQSHPIDDQHWEFIEYCWAPVQERPSAEHLVLSVLGFLRSYPHPQLLYGLLVPSEKSSLQSTLSEPLLSPSNVEQFSPNVPPEVLPISESLLPNRQDDLLLGSLSSLRTALYPPHSIRDSNSSIFPLLPPKPLTQGVPVDGDGNEAASQASFLQETLNQSGSEVNPDISVTDTMLPKRPPPAHSKFGATSPLFLNTSIGEDRLNIYPLLYPSPQQHSIEHQHSQATTAFRRGDRGTAPKSRDGIGGIWSLLPSRFSPFARATSTSMSDRDINHLCSKQDAVDLHQAKSDSGHDHLSYSMETSFYTPRSSQMFTTHQSQFRQEKGHPIHGHSSITSSGSRGGGDGTWSTLSSGRPSPYPSLFASPRVRHEDFQNVTITDRPSSVLYLDPPQPTSGSLVTSKQTITSERTAGSSHRRRKQDANFLCPVPGCGSTFTRSFNLKGHMRSHNEGRPFLCKWPSCGKSFARQHDCKRHEQLHSSYRPFTCNVCNKTFVCMESLNRHLRSEGGAECQRILDVAEDSGRLPASEAEEKGWSGAVQGLILDHVDPSLLLQVTLDPCII